jgi:hypothetical protein
MSESQKKFQLHLMYLSISLVSCFCVMTNFYVIQCSNIVGLMCLIDFYFVRRKDMILHHFLVLCMLHYMNNHDDIKNRSEIVSVILSTEISTIFLTTNNLLEMEGNMVIAKNINKLLFVSTFVYYRIYNYIYYLILDNNIHKIFYYYSKNNFEFFEIYSGVYGLFFLNLYWCGIILKKIVFTTLYNKIGANS